ncbi:unnamed protein product, partial [Mesorhabditis belari]|uniref:Uncharacterized protein n=1 Tax=Mesorhabditis belari TaxID=2138241 RepID=A0AAF3EHR9_9BILA
MLINSLLIFATCLPLVWPSKRESDLYRALQAKYNPLVRPVRDPERALNVSMKVFLQQIIDVNEKDQIIEVNAWLQFKWKDYRLRWSPSRFENITSVRFATSEDGGPLWRPDVLLYNSADEQFDSMFKSNMVVSNTGEIQWVPPGVFKVTCKIDITWFPFDSQTCFMKFGSWSYHGKAIDLLIDTEESGESMDLSTYVSNGEWLLVDAPAIRETKYYACCEEPYPTIKFYIYIKRRTLFYAFNLIIPSLLISIMTLMCFCLPAHDMAEKIGYQTTILLSVCFFLTVLSEMTPNTSEALPLIGIFFSTVTLILSCSTAFTITVLSLRYRQPANHRMTKGMRFFFTQWLPWLLMMRRPGHRFQKGRAKVVEEEKEETKQDIVEPKSNRVSLQVDEEHLEVARVRRSETLLDVLCDVPKEQLSLERKVGEGLFAANRQQSIESRRSNQMEKYIKRCIETTVDQGCEENDYTIRVFEYFQAIHSQLKLIREEIDKKNALQDTLEEWKFAAMCLDRLCLIVFSAFLSTSIFIIFYSAPYLNA